MLLHARGSPSSRLLSKHPTIAPATGSLRNSPLVLEILEAGHTSQDALAHQSAHFVDDQLRMPRIVETRGHTLVEIQGSLGKAGKQEPASGGDSAARDVGLNAPWPGPVAALPVG